MPRRPSGRALADSVTVRLVAAGGPTADAEGTPIYPFIELGPFPAACRPASAIEVPAASRETGVRYWVVDLAAEDVDGYCPRRPTIRDEVVRAGAVLVVTGDRDEAGRSCLLALDCEERL